jgi:RNA polymerase sigma-70 factor (ECF subfamily)
MVVQEEEGLEELLRARSLEGEVEKSRDEDKKAKLRLIDQGLEKIGAECREIVVLRDKEEKTYLEIGRLLKVPLGTVMSRLSRCKKALKILIEQTLREG